jgi:SAM-dependent methyltransferase
MTVPSHSADQAYGHDRLHDILAELERSGLAPDLIRANPGKLRLSLDLAALVGAKRHLRVLDVGCAGPTPLNLWEPFGPLISRFELVGVDVAGLDRAAARARQLGVPIALRTASALGLTNEFGRDAFDVVVSTQVLEHVRPWKAALTEMRDVLRPSGIMLLTCDSRHVQRTLSTRLRLQGKRAYAALRPRAGIIARLGDRFVSGEWEKGLTVPELRDAASELELDVEQLSPYTLGEVKHAQHEAGSGTRLAWLALEEELVRETPTPPDLSLYTMLYLRARRP